MSSAVQHVSKPRDGRARVVIERPEPLVDGGRYFAKRVRGEALTIAADVFADGHDVLRAVARTRHTPFGAGASPSPWVERPMAPLGNDAWQTTVCLDEEGWLEFAITAWIDAFATWRDGLQKKHAAGVDVESELREGAALVHAAADRVQGASRTLLAAVAGRLSSDGPQDERVRAAVDGAVLEAMQAADNRPHAVESAGGRVRVERVRARTGAWYEMFPRSYTPDATRSATFGEAATRLPAIAAMGFDVLYLPPIHPIGSTNRKGRNNTLVAAPGDPGSPWAIGAEDGGHTAIESGLGGFDDFEAFCTRAEALGLEVALDLAYQCSPDHPWVREHPEWFRHRPDGSIKYAENPPKKYQDIYPIDFDTEQWPALWDALRDVIVFWVERGVRIFRVDNPHTKSFRFWEWAIADVQARHPGVVFLAEAFTRPKVMRHLAKLGFTQSYTYFTWRNSKAEIEEYFTELTTTGMRDYFRPNLFANTPDILHEYLQTGGRPAFQVRLVLAATLGATYGLYSGFELLERVPVRPGSEEYLDSEKYEIKPRNWNVAGSLEPLITTINQIRRQNAALHHNDTLRFHPMDNAQVIAYSKSDERSENRVLVVANLDPFHMQHGFVDVDATSLGLPSAFTAEDLLTGERFAWQHGRNYVRLDPAERVPAHIFRLEVMAS
jgi:starch synthase (maltosyl-transferring)